MYNFDLQLNNCDKDRLVPHILPHYNKKGNRIYFMISQRPTLDLNLEEMEIFNSIDGKRTLNDIINFSGLKAQKLLYDWHERGIVVFVPLIKPPKYPHLVVIEPHMDDAVLSVGGRLINRRGKQRMTILSVTKLTNFTSYIYLKRDFLDVEQVTNLRIQESQLAAKLLGAEFCYMDWASDPLRLFPTECWTIQNLERLWSARNSYGSSPPDPQDVEMLEKLLLPKIADLHPDEIWIPMGLGMHVDHRTVRSACIRMLADNADRFSGIKIQMYEDLPYATRQQSSRVASAFQDAGTSLITNAEEITDVFHEKLRAVSVFASQFKVSIMGSRLRTCAESIGHIIASNKLFELSYLIDNIPSLPPEWTLSSNQMTEKSFRTKAFDLLYYRKNNCRLSIIALPSAHLGRWQRNVEILLSFFPKTHIFFYIAKECIWEVQGTVEHQKITINCIQPSIKEWVITMLGNFFRFRTTTIILWWGATEKKMFIKRYLIKVFFPFQKIIFAESLTDICIPLAELEVAGEFRTVKT